MTMTPNIPNARLNTGAQAPAGPQGTQAPNKLQSAPTDLGIFNVNDYGATGDGATEAR